MKTWTGNYIYTPSDGIPEPTQWNGQDDRPMPSVDEDQKDRDWAALEAAARDFVKTYGAAAMLRCISCAVDDQRSLLR